MVIRSWIVAAIIAAAGRAAAAHTAVAQAPHLTPQGDPSVETDSICKLAVNPVDYPEETSVFLLDEGAVRLEADGKGSRIFRQIA